MKSGILTVNSFMYDIAIVCESVKRKEKKDLTKQSL
jgi:hypothetical protein